MRELSCGGANTERWARRYQEKWVRCPRRLRSTCESVDLEIGGLAVGRCDARVADRTHRRGRRLAAAHVSFVSSHLRVCWGGSFLQRRTTAGPGAGASARSKSARESSKSVFLPGTYGMSASGDFIS